MNSIFSQKRFLLWMLISISVLITFDSSFWNSILDMFSYDFIFGEHHASPYGMLVLCGFFLFSKKKEIKEEAVRKGSGKKHFYIACGVVLIAAAVLMPAELDFLILKPAFVLAGAFALVFGRVAKIPLVILMIYTAATTFPMIIANYAETGYAKTAVVPVKAIAWIVGLPLVVNNQLLNLLTSTGDSITVMVTAACAGPTTMGVFLGLFALMHLDMPLSLKRAAAIFAFGVAGTWLQSIIRILIILGMGYNFGEEALWTAHFWTIYILFPVWYLIFALVYFKQVGRKSLAKPA